MRTCTVKLTSMTPYSASKIVAEEKPSKESWGDYEARVWRKKATTDDDGVVCIPAMGLKMAVDEAVKRLSLSVPGKKGSTYTKFFLAGQLCVDMPGIRLGKHVDDIDFIDIWANSNGIRGSGSRVIRRFPYVKEWAGTATFHVLDDVIPNDIFEKAVVESGRLVGVGRFRPEKGGLLGRFSASNFSWAVM